MTKLKKTIPFSIKLSLVLLVVYILSVVYKVVFDSLNDQCASEWIAYILLGSFSLCLLHASLFTLIAFFQSKGKEYFLHFIFISIMFTGLIINTSLIAYLDDIQIRTLQVILFLTGYFGFFWSWNKRDKFVKVK